MSKLTPDPVPIPDAATPPSSNVVGGPIAAAAAATQNATAEAAALKSVLGNSQGMSGGGEVEVQIPGGGNMPSAGNGPSFANNYTGAVSLLNNLQSQGAADKFADAPAMNVTGGGYTATGDVENAEVSGTAVGSALVGRHWSTPSHKFHAAELAKGVKMELEHTDNHRIALEIAKDHLSELPDYYTRLEKMEKRAMSERKKKGGKTKRNGRSDKRTRRGGKR